MVGSPATRDHRRPDWSVLGLEPDEADPVRIILAAQLRLRGCRRGHVAGSRYAASEVRRIIAARDALLSHVVGSLTRPGVRGITGGRSLAPAGGAAATAVRELDRQ